MKEIIQHTLIHSIKDVIHLIPFLFLAFLIIELIEHKFSKKTKNAIAKSGKLGPLLGSALGLFPQCGFSMVTTNLYVTRIISLGTLVAIYLSTSDEMLPILLSNNAKFSTIATILGLKFLIGMVFGFIIDFILRKKKKEKIDYNICDEEECHCEKGIILSSIKHTLKTIIFIFIATFILTFLIETLGEENISKIFLKDNVFAPFISSLIGLIPNCAASVIITELYISEAITLGTALAGLLTGSGVAILLLFKSNKNLKENLIILGLIYGIGVISGIAIEIISYFI